MDASATGPRPGSYGDLLVLRPTAWTPSVVGEVPYPESSIQLGDPVIAGSLDAALVTATITRHRSSLRYCHQREVSRTPGLQGELVVRFRVGPDGTVADANLASDSMKSASVASCVVGRFSRMRFPPPSGGGVAVVQQSLEFR